MKDIAFIKPFGLLPVGGKFFRTVYRDDGSCFNTYWVKTESAGIAIGVNVETGEFGEFAATDIVCELKFGYSITM